MTATHTELNLLDGVTANTTELNYVDVATLGTAEASKALTVDASKDVTGIRNITATGALSVGSGTVGGNTIATLANIYPVGSIYMNASDSTNPATLLGFGTWVAFGAGRVPVGQNTSDSDFNTLEETGGEKNHTLTIAEMPSHNHNQPAGILPPPNANDVDVTGGNASTLAANVSTDNTGGGQGHNNLQPYIVVKMWKRTA
jgi:hypothetical protein